MGWVRSFLPDQLNRALAPPFAAFFIALLGVFLSVVGWLAASHWLSVVGLVVVCIGLAGRIVTIAIFQVWAVREMFRKQKSE